MVRFTSACLAVGVLVGMHMVGYAAVPPSEDLLPNTTKGYLSVPSVNQLTEAFNETQLGHLANDPQMKPFVDDLKRQLREKWTRTHQKLGITWEDLESVPSGEVAVALILPDERHHALAVVADVTGNKQQTDALLVKIDEQMAAEKAVRSERRLLNATVIVFDVPKRDELPARQVAYLVKDDLLAASDDLAVMRGIIRRLGSKGSDSLAGLSAFESIMQRCEQASGDVEPHARWFIEPFGYADAMRLDKPKKRGTDMLKILKSEGFTAVEGVGGFVNFAVNKYEMLHRTFIFAPGNQSGGQRFRLSARMLKFPAGGTFQPPAWVPRSLSAYAAINLDTKNAFENSKTLVNQIVGDEVFEDVLESIKTDENGPQIDIRRDLIGYLGNRITFISDLQLPVTPKSERLLVGVETTDDEHMAQVIKAWMETDPDTRRHEIDGHVVWEIVDPEAELPMVTIENSPLDSQFDDEEMVEEDERALPPNSAVTVAFGQLFVASHIDILKKVLTEYENGPKLAGSADYLRVEAELAELALPEQFGQAFTRTDEAYRGAYELLRTGKMPQSESLMGKLLNSMLGDGKEGELRQQRIDGSKLPSYDMVRRYLGPAGMTMTPEATGWLLTGFTLTKESAPTDADSPVANTVTTGDVSE